MDGSLLASSVHGFPQERVLEWVAIPFSRVKMINLLKLHQDIV